MPAGTPIYAINGYKSSFRIAVRTAEKISVYQAFDNPNAEYGADLADIADKVDYIGVNEETQGEEIAAIRDEEKVKSMVTMFLNAPVSKTRTDRSGTRYFIAFHLKDGSKYERAYWLESGEFANGIMLHEGFRKEVEESMKQAKQKPLIYSLPFTQAGRSLLRTSSISAVMWP